MIRALSLALLAAGLAVPASAQTRGSVWANYSWGKITHNYNAEGDTVTYRASGIPAEAIVQRAALGASYNVMQLGEASVYVAGELALASLAVNPSYGTTTLESGFKPQSLNLAAGYTTPRYGFYAGFMADIGSDLNVNAQATGTTVDLPNSDGAHAVVLGGHVSYPMGALQLGVGADYFLTLQSSETVSLTTVSPALAGTYAISYDQDPADYLSLHAHVGYHVIPSVEVGLKVAYLNRMAGSVEKLTVEGDDPVKSAVLGAAIRAGLNPLPGRTAEEDGNALGLIPYLTYTSASLPIKLSLLASTTREYEPYGFTLRGQNMPVGRTGFTVGLAYGF